MPPPSTGLAVSL
ncbi:hypothetical protein ACMD2_06818 [Ananas comosus]|uniref:Uncharacterized protein n=1 Tax=Ananas comosus TaxID=4615 RepID=A0A199VBQ4_ANACO|nr:hypothetical protein ACMD2_06818 [Ananas comosus]